MGFSVWDVAEVPTDPCHPLTTMRDPGPTVDDLVKALVAQKSRDASKPQAVTVDGHPGQYLEWSVPKDAEVVGDADFVGCDVQDNGHLDFVSWMAARGGERYQQEAGQVDRLWILDLDGHRLLADATYSLKTTACGPGRAGGRRGLPRVRRQLAVDDLLTLAEPARARGTFGSSRMAGRLCYCRIHSA